MPTASTPEPIAAPAADAPPSGREWNDPAVVAVGKLAPRSMARSFASIDEARSATVSLAMDGPEPDVDSARVRSLDGPWDFRWVPRPADVPVGHHQPGFSTEGWDTIEVPSVWELQGYGNLIYAPAHLPPALRGGAPPSIDVERAPVGCYQRTFEVPDTWEGLRVTTAFHGVSSAMYLWVNGTYIGYSQVSRSPAEFDVTAALRPGTNHVAVQVHRWCDGSYLENQDMWFLSGIFRSVELRAEPTVRLDDVELRTGALDGAARLDVEVSIGAGSAAAPVSDLAEGYTFEVSVAGPGEEASSGPVPVPAGPPGAVRCSVAVPAARRWTAETPELYDVQVALTDPTGEVCDVRRFRHGFRIVEIRDRQLLVNGVPVLLAGVNRHDLDPETGSTMTAQRLRADVALLKQANVNAVRTAHYPDDERFYDLCDEVGLYVMDEADLESHAVRRTVPGSDPRWTVACVDRAERLVRRDRNRACVVMWSLGNEAGFGSNHAEMAARIRALDPTRPIHYEGDHQAAVTDVWSAMYATPQQLRRGARGEGYPLRRTNVAEQIWSGRQVSPQRMAEVPLVLCEYAHCMGNSLGNIDEYVEIFRTHDNCIGGFIWDFADQGLRHQLDDGTTMWARGGDLTDELGYGAFCSNGIVAADRTPHPAYHQVAAVYAPVAIATATDGAHLEVQNRFSFRHLAGADLRWRWTADGAPIGQWSKHPLEAAPGETERVPLGEEPEAPGEAEVRVEAAVVADRPVPWSADGEVLATVSLASSQAPAPRPASRRMRTRTADPARPALHIEGGDHVVRAADVVVRLDGATGEVTSYEVDGVERLASPVAPNLWRAQTDNEVAMASFADWTRGRDLNPWRTFTRRRRCTGTTAEILADGRVHLRSTWRILGGVRPFTIDWTVDGAGNLDVDARFTPLLDLPRMGITFEVVPGLDALTWFGRGPHETMWDRKSGAPVGRYHRRVDDLVHSYLRPQENGNRTDVRWAILSGGPGDGATAASGPTLTIADGSGEGFEVTARPYRQSELADATHSHLLERRDTTTVTIDRHQRGAGGDIPAGLSTVGLHRQFALRRLVPQRLTCTISPHPAARPEEHLP